MAIADWIQNLMGFGGERVTPQVPQLDINDPVVQQQIQQLGGFGPNLTGFQAPANFDFQGYSAPVQETTDFQLPLAGAIPGTPGYAVPDIEPIAPIEPINFSMNPSVVANAIIPQPLAIANQLVNLPNSLGPAPEPDATYEQKEGPGFFEQAKGLGQGLFFAGRMKWKELKDEYDLVSSARDIGIKSPTDYKGADYTTFVQTTDNIIDLDISPAEAKAAYANAGYDVSDDGISYILSKRLQQRKDLQKFAKEKAPELPMFSEATEDWQPEYDKLDANISTALAPLSDKFSDTVALRQGVSDAAFAYKKDAEYDLNNKMGIQRIAQDLQGDTEVAGWSQIGAEIYDTAQKQKAQIAAWKLEGLTSKQIADKYKELGYENVNEFLWAGSPLREQFKGGPLSRQMSPTDALERLKYNANNKKFIADIKDYNGVVDTTIDASALLSSYIGNLLSMAGDVVANDWVATTIDKNSLYGQNIGALNQIVGVGKDTVVPRSAIRFTSDLLRLAPELVTLGVATKLIGAARGGTAVDIANNTQRAIRASNRLKYLVGDAAPSAAKIEGAMAYAQKISNIVKAEAVPSTVYNAVFQAIDTEADKEGNKNFNAGATLFFDLLLPVSASAIAEGFRYARGLSTYTDAYKGMKEIISKSAKANGATSVEAIEDLQKAFNLGYANILDGAIKAENAGGAAAEAYNKKLKEDYARRETRRLEAYRQGYIDRSVVDNGGDQSLVNMDAVRYAEGVLSDIRNTNRNIADMIKVNGNIEGQVVFGPYRSSVLLPVDMKAADTVRYRKPVIFNKILSPVETGVNKFDANKFDAILSIDDIDAVGKSLVGKERVMVNQIDGADVYLDNVFSKDGVSKYFDKVQGGYKLNDKGLDALQVSKVGYDAADIGVKTSADGFYNALESTDVNRTLYKGDINKLRELNVYERVEEIISPLVKC